MLPCLPFHSVYWCSRSIFVIIPMMTVPSCIRVIQNTTPLSTHLRSLSVPAFLTFTSAFSERYSQPASPGFARTRIPGGSSPPLCNEMCCTNGLVTSCELLPACISTTTPSAVLVVTQCVCLCTPDFRGNEAQSQPGKETAPPGGPQRVQLPLALASPLVAPSWFVRGALNELTKSEFVL